MRNRQERNNQQARWVAQHQNSCIHFRGYQHDTCNAGIDWRALTGGDAFGIARRAPCHRDNQSIVTCEACRYPTPEETAAYLADMDAHIARLEEDGRLISAAHRAQHMAVSQVYVCELCPRAARHVTDSRHAMIIHWQEAHALVEDQWLAASQQFVAHSDARTWSQDDTRYTLTDGRDLLLRSVRIRRTGDNAAAWRDNE